MVFKSCSLKNSVTIYFLMFVDVCVFIIVINNVFAFLISFTLTIKTYQKLIESFVSIDKRKRFANHRRGGRTFIYWFLYIW